MGLIGSGRVQSFVLILGRVGLGHFTCGSGWVGSRKLDPRLTLIWLYCILLTLQEAMCCQHGRRWTSALQWNSFRYRFCICKVPSIVGWQHYNPDSCSSRSDALRRNRGCDRRVIKLVLSFVYHWLVDLKFFGQHLFYQHPHWRTLSAGPDWKSDWCGWSEGSLS